MLHYITPVMTATLLTAWSMDDGVWWMKRRWRLRGERFRVQFSHAEIIFRRKSITHHIRTTRAIEEEGANCSARSQSIWACFHSPQFGFHSGRIECNHQSMLRCESCRRKCLWNRLGRWWHDWLTSQQEHFHSLQLHTLLREESREEEEKNQVS